MNLSEILFHGSVIEIQTPVFGKGPGKNDYGVGFYCTPSQTLGSEWAVKNQTDGYLNKYEIEYDGLKILDLESSEYTVLHWITILIKNREANVKSKLAKQ